MVRMLLANRGFWRLVEKVKVDRRSPVAVCQMDLLSELLKLDCSA
jgi:hypothetical protein